MQVFIGADYRGYELKEKIMGFLAGNEHIEIIDKGTYDSALKEDFNDSAVEVALAVRDTPSSFGILICDSAHGMTMQANRFKGIRAAHCENAESAKLAREHDDANVVCLSAHALDAEQAYSIVKTFLDTDFERLERRIRRINRLDEREDYA